jgi:hypothetical protein
VPDDERSILIEILQRVTRVETEVGDVKSRLDGMANAKEIAQEALQSSRSSHHRIDELKTDTSEGIKELKEGQTWLWRTALGGLGAALMSAIGALYALLSNHK